MIDFRESRPVTPAFSVRRRSCGRQLGPRIKALEDQAYRPIPAQQAAAQVSDSPSKCQHIAIPKRFSVPLREIWTAARGWKDASGPACGRSLLEHPRFAAA